MNAKHARTLRAIYARPTVASLAFADIERLLVALGAATSEGAGSRVTFELRGESWHAHRPHPGKEAKKYQVEQVRELLLRIGVVP